jgi:two-component system chemotaxis response regulator CheY
MQLLRLGVLILTQSVELVEEFCPKRRGVTDEIDKILHLLTFYSVFLELKKIIIKMNSKYKIMLLDDSSQIRLMLRHILRNENYNIICEASNGENALLLLKEKKPDIILLDIMMPKMDGVEFLKILQEHYSDFNLKIIVITATATREIVENAIKSGAKGFILKPFTPGKVLETLDIILKK